jgi:predicted ATPase
MADVLATYLSGKRLLLILDNLEQVIRAAPRIAALLGAAPTFVILGSSREQLGVAGETVYPVPPLSLPSEPGTPTARQVAAQESVELFVERARAARSGFELTDANAGAVAAICRRVDGLPLAIELAAARANVLTPQQILERLDHRLTLLSGSRRDVTDRQRTLRGAIDWSHDLLSDDEKAGFRRFSVFAGGAQLDAVLAVLDPDAKLSVDAIDLVSALVDRSLLRSTDDANGSRFAMLETIREYAAERLAASDEATYTRNCHAAFYAEVAARSRAVLQAPDRDAQLDRLDSDMPNLRAALEWAIEDGNFERAAVIAVGLKDFWRTRSHFAESRRLLNRVLEALEPLGATHARADVLGVAGELAAWQGDYEQARSLSGAQIATLEAIGDRPGLAMAWSTVGWGNLTTQADVAHQAFERAVGIAREVDDLPVLQGALQGDAIALLRLGESGLARAKALEAYEVGEVASDEYTNTFNVMTVGLIDLHMGNRDSAAVRFADALRRSEAAGGQIGIVVAIDAIAFLALDMNDVATAARLAVAAERLRQQIGGAPSMAIVGEQPILDKVRDRYPDELARAEANALELDTQQAISIAYSVTDTVAKGEVPTTEAQTGR